MVNFVREQIFEEKVGAQIYSIPFPMTINVLQIVLMKAKILRVLIIVDYKYLEIRQNSNFYLVLMVFDKTLRLIRNVF